jgi:RimJ/RimL family protein N-acetyltransferase
MGFSLRTPRLLLRPWREADIAPFAAMCADPAVMEFFERPATPAECRAIAERMPQTLASAGFCFWALEHPGEADFIGFTGLQPVSFAAPFAPTVEIGWRLARRFWGRGLATEAATAALHDGFTRCALPDIVAFTVPANLRSQRVMQRIGMVRDMHGDFDHPKVTPGHPLQRHMLYRAAWRTS